MTRNTAPLVRRISSPSPARVTVTVGPATSCSNAIISTPRALATVASAVSEGIRMPRSICDRYEVVYPVASARSARRQPSAVAQIGDAPADLGELDLDRPHPPCSSRVMNNSARPVTVAVPDTVGTIDPVARSAHR